MMFVNLFENAFTSDYKKLEVENNSSILEIAKNNNLDLENCLIFVNGSQKTSNYILKENDVCTIRQFPGAATVATVLFASVATLVSVELVKGAVSVISGGKYGGEPLINSFLPKSTDVNVANTQQNASMNLPSINGASNQKALGKAIPFIIGKTLFAPYVINDGYTTISDGDGKDKYGGIQTFHCLYLVGYNDLKIENVSLGSHLISSNSENIENGKLKNDGTYFSEADYSPLIEIQQGSNEVSLIPQKVVQTNYNVELLYSVNESLKAYGFSAKYPHKIEFEVQFPNGLYGYDSDGNQIEKTVDIHIQMSIDGGKTWIKTPFTLSHTTDVSSSDETINRITAKHFYTMRLVGVMSISDYDYANSIENHVVQFKVWKTVAKNSENNNDVDNLVFSAIRTWCYNDKESNSSVGLVAQVPMIEKYRDRTCRLGFEIKADTYTSGTLQELNLIATSKAHIWDGIGWSTTTKATNNPASLALLALTKNARGDYSYKTTVQKNYLISDKLDLESFGRLYELCDKNISWTSSKGISYSVKQFECNGAVLNQTKTLDLVNSILRCCRSFITLRGKKYGIFSDVEQENSVLILSNQNVYSRTNSKDFADIPDGFSINFVNALEDYQEDTIIVVPNGVDETNPDLKLEQLEYPYITNAYHVKKEGLYQLRCRNLRREIWNASIGIDGYLIEVGDKVEIQDDTILVGIGDGAEVKNVILDNSNSGILGIKTDAKFHITDLSQTYGIRFTKIVERNGEQVPRVFVKKVTVRETQDNYYDEFYFIDEISLDDESKIEIDDIIVFGIYGKETTEAICFGKKDNGDNSFELTLIPYDKNVYNDSLTKFDYDSKITKYVSEGSVIGLTEESLNERLQKSNSNIQSQISKIEDSINNIVLDADTTPPTIPILQSCISDNLGDISITFLQSIDEESGVHHYVLYKKQDGGMLEQSLIIEYDEQATSGYIIKDYPSVKNKNYTYYVSAVDNNGNESALSNGINVKSEVTEKPYIPTNFIATAFENYIKLHWDFEKSTNSVYNPNRFKLEVKRNSTSNWEEIAESSINEFSYYFDRTKDGYPEIDDLSAYQFRVKSISVYDVESDYCSLTKIKTDNYLGWEIGTIDVSSYAVEGLLYVKINYTNSSYGEKYFTINYGDNVIAENVSSGRLFAFKLIGYQEVSDITNKDIIVSCKSVANNSSVTLKGSNIDISLYKTYKITKPTVSAYADRTGVHINWTDNSGDYYLIPTYTLQINSKDVLSAKNVLSYDNLFDNNIYPTKDDIAKISIKLKVETEADSVEVSNITIDVSNFLGWIPNVPDIRISVSGRTVPLSWNIQNDNVYDFLGCEIQVAKAYKILNDTYTVITDKTELEWYAPALGLNPYENLDNYKKGDKDSYLSVKGSSVAFSVPLYGQDNDGTISTMYAYRARAYTKGGKSAWTDTYFVEVKPVSAYDVVKAWDLNDNGEKVKLDGALGVKQIFVEELAAISANLGYITDGALQGDQYNYWAVNDIKLEDGTVLCKGAFRVGGKEQYIEVKPIIKNGVATGEYNINFVVNDVSISSDGTRIDGQSFTVYDKDGQLMFKTSPEGNFILVDEGTFTYNKPLATTLYTDIPNNMLLMDVTKYRIVNNLNYNDKIYTAILFLSPSYDDYGNSFLSLYSEDDKIQIWSSKDWQKDNSPYNILKSSDNKLVALRVDCTSNNTVSFKKSVYDFESNKLNDSLLYSYNTSNTPTDDLFLVLYELTKEDTMPMVLDDWLINATCTEDSATYDNTTTFYALNLKTNSYFIKSVTDRNPFFDNDYSYITKDDNYFYILSFGRLSTICVRINIENQEIGIIGLPFVSYQGTRESFFNVKENSFVRCVNNKLYVFLITPSFYKTTQSAETLTTDAIGIIDLSAVNWATSSSNIQLSKGILYTCNSARYYPISVFSKNTDIYLIDRYWQSDGTSDTTNVLAPFLTNFFFCSLKDDKKISYELTEIAGTVNVEKSKKLKNINYDSGPVFTYDFLVSTPRCFVDSNNEVTMQGLQPSITDDGCITDYLANGFTSDLGDEYALYFLSLEKSFAKITNIKFYKELSHEITKKEVYGTGIGFTQILYDNKNNVIRYGLDNGFHLDFDKEGNLLSTQGEQGIRGEKGDKGDKGDTGAIGAQGYSIVSSVSRNEQTDDWWSIYGTIGHSEAWNNTENSRNGCRIGDIFTVVGTSTSGKAHIAFYKSTTASGKLTGTCIAYSYAEKGEKGDKGDKGTTGNGISSITYYYATSTSQTQPSTITSTSIPTLSTTNKYLWQKQVITYTDGTNKTNIALICVYGDKGNTGEKGTSITKVEQTETSSVSGGKNKLTVTLSDGTKSEFVVTNGKLIFPVGFVYTQYSGTASPATLGLEVAENCAWVDITSKYTGAFFRAYYSSSGSFSDTSISQQSSQLSSHKHTIDHEHTVSTSVSNAHHVYFTGSKGHPSANANVNTDYQLGGNSNTSVSVSVGSYSGSSGPTGSSELRPRNVAIKIWQVQEV